VGVGARHALFPVYRTLGAPPARVGGRFPDASPRGNAGVSVSWQDRRRNCFRRLLGEAFQRGSVHSCRSGPATQGDETAATRPRLRWSPGLPSGNFPRSVGLAVRVLPLIPQWTFVGAGRRRVFSAHGYQRPGGSRFWNRRTSRWAGKFTVGLLRSRLFTRCPRASVSGRRIMQGSPFNPSLGSPCVDRGFEGPQS